MSLQHGCVAPDSTRQRPPGFIVRSRCVRPPRQNRRPAQLYERDTSRFRSLTKESSGRKNAPARAERWRHSEARPAISLRVRPTPFSKRHLAAWLVVTASALACNRAPLDTSTDVDLEQFQGKWHEVAHIPRLTQAECTATQATYTMQSDGKLAVVHECTLANGQYQGSTALATVREPSAPA